MKKKLYSALVFAFVLLAVLLFATSSAEATYVTKIEITDYSAKIDDGMTGLDAIETVKNYSVPQNAGYSKGNNNIVIRQGEFSLMKYDVHTHVYDQKIAEAKYLKTPADCETRAVYYMSCECGAKGSETFPSGEVLGHDFGSWIIVNGTEHKHVCERNESHAEYGEHIFDGEHCYICGYSKSSGFAVTFKMNGHGEQVSAQSVEKEGKVQVPKSPSADGWIFGGWYADEELSVLFDFDIPVRANITLYAKWSCAHVESSWRFDESSHWTECTVVGCGSTIKPRSPHDDQNSDGRCDICNYDMEHPCEHLSTELREVKKATCTSAGFTGITYCKDCGVTISIGSFVEPFGHEWSLWESLGETSHKRSCSLDKAHVEIEAHKMMNGRCEVCGYATASETSYTVWIVIIVMTIIIIASAIIMLVVHSRTKTIKKNNT